jgi:hypothetical protein
MHSQSTVFTYLHRTFLAGSRTLKSGKGLRVISATRLVM